MSIFKHIIQRFSKREDGVALVEFALFLPLFLLSFFVIVEFARVFFAYQGAIVGVRDAARYMARVVPADICVDAGGVGDVLEGAAYNNVDAVNGRHDAIYQIVWRNMDTEDTSLLPVNVFLLDVDAVYRCVLDEGAYRQEEVPVVIVAADIEIRLPLIGILEFNNVEWINNLSNITHTVIDESRIFGV